MRRRRRVTARFFFIIFVLLTVIAFLIARPHLKFAVRTDEVFASNSSYTQQMPCVIVRDEDLVTASSIIRTEYVARERSLVERGDLIANLYTAGYSENLLTRLETTRANIQTYHKTLLGTIVDAGLSRLETAIDISAQDFKKLVTHQTTGNLQTVMEQLSTAMVNRQDYLRQNKRDDTRLTQLYEEENTRLSSIRSWRKDSTASRDGVVSFYLDGYETDLNAQHADEITIDDIQTALAGGNLPHSESIRSDGVYRIVNQDEWYVYVLNDDETWSPVVGQVYYLQLEGFDDLVFSAEVTNVQKVNGTQMASFGIHQPIGPLIYQRAGKAVLSINLTGLAVHSKVLSRQGSEFGVWLYDTPGGTFVPVNVLSNDGKTALIQPVAEGALSVGQTLLIK